MKKINSKTPTVSIVMPVYNTEMYIEEAILSVVRQTYKDFELLIIDDGSTDKSYEIIRRLARSDKRINVIRNRVNRGIGYTMSRLVSTARGKYIARMDADDVMMPTRIETEVAYLESHKDVGIVGSYMGEIDDEGNFTSIRKVPVSHEEIISSLLTRQAIQNPTLMLRKSAIKKSTLHFDAKYSPVDDLDFYMRAAHDNVKFANIPAYLMLYRKHDKNSSLSNIRKTFRLSCQIRDRELAASYVMFPVTNKLIYGLQRIVVRYLPEKLLYPLYQVWQGGGMGKSYKVEKVGLARKLKISLVMPVYKGALLIDESVKRVVEAMRKTNKIFELIVVVDGDSDSTKNKLKRLAKLYPELRYFSYKENRGKGFAVKYGINKARGEYIGYIDAGHDIGVESLTNMVYSISDDSETKVFVADKNNPMSLILNVPWYRKVFSFGFSMMVKLLLGDLGDTQVGLKIFHKDVIQPILKDQKLKISGFAFDVEIMKAINDLQIKKTFVPVVIRRNGEKSTVTRAHVWQMVKDLLKLYISNRSSIRENNIFVARKELSPSL